MTMIGDRPVEVAGRAVPGHWEGDLITGAANRSAIGTLVERSTRYVLLVHLPAQHTADATRTGVVKMMSALPVDLRRSLTWDQGCLLYTSDAADDLLCVDLGGRRIIKK